MGLTDLPGMDLRSQGIGDFSPQIMDPRAIQSVAAATEGGSGGAGALSQGFDALSAGLGIGQSATQAILQFLRARQAAKLSRDLSKFFRRESYPVIGQLVGLPAVEGKGGFGAQPMDPLVALSQQLLRSPPQYTDEDIEAMETAQRSLNPRLRALSGPATGRSLTAALLPPTRYWESVLQPAMEALAANLGIRQQAAAAGAARRGERYRLAAGMVR